MDRKMTEGYFVSDEELLAALEDSEFQFDDLDDDPNFTPNGEINDDESEDEGETNGAVGDKTMDQISNIRPSTTETVASYESENEDVCLDLDQSAAGPSRQPANVGLTLRGNQYRGRRADRGRGSDRGRREGRGRGEGRGRRGGCGRSQQRGRGGGDGDGRNRRPQTIWAGETLNTDFPPFMPPADERCNRDGWNALQYFNEYFDDRFIDLMVEKTNIYYHVKTGRELRVTKEQIKKIIGITMLMSTLGYPRIRLYWDLAFKIPLISKAMTRDRFFTIRSATHVANDTDVTAENKAKDKLWKVSPVIDKFRETVLKIPRQEEASIDEQMIPFTGHVGFRQFVPRKPNPTGLKNYVLSSKNGLILDFEIYQGKVTTRLPAEINAHLKLGTGGRAVMRLSETCLPGTNLYFDRYFTGLALLEALRAKGISGTGTTMKNRFPNINFKSDAVLSAEGRGSCDTKIRDDEKVLALKWVDNKVITLASTRHGAEPFTPARRYSRADREYIQVQMPDLVSKYNVNMGGVDLHNRMLSHYRSYHRTNKWPVRFMEHFFDMACVNSWITYKDGQQARHTPNKDIMDMHFFKMRLSQLLILGVDPPANTTESDDSGDEQPPRKKLAGRPGNVSLPPREARIKQALHLPQAMDLSSAPSCRNPGCKARSRIKCLHCQVFLCVSKERNCFLEFHR